MFASEDDSEYLPMLVTLTWVIHIIADCYRHVMVLWVVDAHIITQFSGKHHVSGMELSISWRNIAETTFTASVYLTLTTVFRVWKYGLNTTSMLRQPYHFRLCKLDERPVEELLLEEGQGVSEPDASGCQA